MRRRDIGVSVQPGFIYVEGDIYFHNLEAERVNRFIPLRTYLDNGIRVFANSDMTSAHYNPFLGMRAAVTRRTSRGVQLGQRRMYRRDGNAGIVHQERRLLFGLGAENRQPGTR